MSRAVLRWQVPIDDEDHEVVCDGPVLGAEACHGLWSNLAKHWVSFWTCGSVDGQGPRVFRVFGMGQPVPDGYVWRATADRLDGLVWHLFERCEADPPVFVRLDVAGVDEDALVAAVRRALRRTGGGGDAQTVLGGGR